MSAQMKIFSILCLIMIEIGGMAFGISPAGGQFAAEDIVGESYEPERIVQRLVEINNGCTGRMIGPYINNGYGFIGSLARHRPLSDATVMKLLDMVDILDSTHIAWFQAVASRENVKESNADVSLKLGWDNSPAAVLLVYSCPEKREMIERSLIKYEGKPQHRILKQVLEQIDLNEQRRILDEEKRKRPKPKKPVRMPHDAHQEVVPVSAGISQNAIYIGSGVMAILIAAWFVWRKRSKN
jgi:hypothetical protein